MQTQKQMISQTPVTLQRQDVDVTVLQLAEGADEVELLLDDRRTVGDQLQASSVGTSANPQKGQQLR